MTVFTAVHDSASCAVTLQDEGTTLIELNKSSADTGGAGNSGGAQIVFTPQLDPGARTVGMFVRPSFANLSGGSSDHTYSLWNGKIGTSADPLPAGSKGNFAFYEGNIDTNQAPADASTGADGMRIFAGTVTGHGGVRLGGSSVAIVSDSVDATIVGHDVGIARHVAGSPRKTVIGFQAASSGSQNGSAAFRALGRWDAAFDGDNLPMVRIGPFVGSGGITVSTLSGIGTRAVSVDSTGKLVIAGSDARLQTDVTPVAATVDVLGLLDDARIRGVFYSSDSGPGARREIGFAAQMFDSIPGLTGISGDSGSSRYLSLNYERITALLWEQNRLLLARNKALQERVEAIEKHLQSR
jgi:hypothetical protein